VRGDTFMFERIAGARPRRGWTGPPPWLGVGQPADTVLVGNTDARQEVVGAQPRA
jgi:hypothetical protein